MMKSGKTGRNEGFYQWDESEESGAAASRVTAWLAKLQSRYLLVAKSVLGRKVTRWQAIAGDGDGAATGGLPSMPETNAPPL